MATRIILLKSSTAGAAPLAGSLEQGEVALNLADRKLYTKDNSNNVVPIGAAFVGPTAPSAPAEGDLWYDAAADLLKSYNGTTWSPTGYTTLTEFGITATAPELNFVGGVTSAIQPQLDGKAASVHTHVIADVTDFTDNSTNWNTAFSWGDHALAGYLTEAGVEADTLETVTARGATTPSALIVTNITSSTTETTGAVVVTGGVGVGENLNVGGNVIIAGDLTVNGTRTAVNSNEVNIGDAVILLNADETGVPSQSAGIEIERGTSANVLFLWDESAGQWSLGNETLGNVTIDGGTY